MRNIEDWKPSKYVYQNGKLRASKNKKEVGVGSRLIADLTAQFYDSALSEYAKGHLLDLGCGKVPFYEAYKSKIDKSTCVDWENTAHKNEFIDMNIDLNATLPFDDNTFDTIILSDVLEHIRKPELLWAEMSRVLTEEGILIMNTPFQYWIHESPFDYYRYTRFALMYFAENSNFEIIKISELGSVIEVFTDFVAKICSSIPIFGPLFSTFIQWINFQFLKTELGKSILEKSSHKFVLSYALIARKV